MGAEMSGDQSGNETSGNQAVATGITGISAFMTGLHASYEVKAPGPVRAVLFAVQVAESLALNALNNGASDGELDFRQAALVTAAAAGGFVGGKMAKKGGAKAITVGTVLGSVGVGYLTDKSYDFFEDQSYTVAEATASQAPLQTIARDARLAAAQASSTLASEMSESQIAQARQLVAAWQPVL